MTEYLVPGVYIQEVSGGVKPIAGVSTSTLDVVGNDMIDRLRLLVAGQRRRREASGEDPAVAVLETIAWLTEQLVARSEPIPDAALPHAARLAAAGLALLAGREAPAGCALVRTRFIPQGEGAETVHAASKPLDARK